jgi:hypothetical protein
LVVAMTTSEQGESGRKEFVLKYCRPLKKKFHVAKFVLGRELNFSSLPQPIHMYREGEENAARVPKIFKDQIKSQRNRPPWVIADDKQTTVLTGTLENEKTKNYFVLIYLPNSDTFQVVPIEEWYKFQPKISGTQRVSLEEAEAQMKLRWKKETTLEPKPKAVKIKEEDEKLFGEEKEPLDLNKFQTFGEVVEGPDEETNQTAPDTEVDAKEIDFDFDFDPLERGDDDQDEDIELAQESEQIKEIQNELTEAGEEMKNVVAKLDVEAIGEVSDVEDDEEPSDDESESNDESDKDNVTPKLKSQSSAGTTPISEERDSKGVKRKATEDTNEATKKSKPTQIGNFDQSLEEQVRKFLLVRGKVSTKELLQQRFIGPNNRDQLIEILKRLAAKFSENNVTYIMLREDAKLHK